MFKTGLIYLCSCTSEQDLSWFKDVEIFNRKQTNAEYKSLFCIVKIILILSVSDRIMFSSGLYLSSEHIKYKSMHLKISLKRKPLCGPKITSGMNG